MPADTLSVSVVQHDVVWHDAAATRRHVAALLDADAPVAGSLVVLPEMFATGFTHDVATQADDGTTHAWLCDVARRYACTFVAGLITRDADGRGRNHAVVIGPDGVELGQYAKRHLFPLGREVEAFDAGTQTLRLDVGGISVCPLICYDLRFPETWRREAGAEAFVLIANWPLARQHHWHALLRARAVENQAYVVAVNRVGSDPSVPYAGGSGVYNFDGRILADAGGSAGVVHATLDVGSLRAFRRKLPFLEGVRK